MKTGKAVLAVITGLVSGAILGVIFASDRESSTRKSISRMGERISDSFDKTLQRKFDDLQKRVEVKSPDRGVLSGRRAEING